MDFAELIQVSQQQKKPWSVCVCVCVGPADMSDNLNVVLWVNTLY